MFEKNKSNHVQTLFSKCHFMTGPYILILCHWERNRSICEYAGKFNRAEEMGMEIHSWSICDERIIVGWSWVRVRPQLIWVVAVGTHGWKSWCIVLDKLVLCRRGALGTACSRVIIWIFVLSFLLGYKLGSFEDFFQLLQYNRTILHFPHNHNFGLLLVHLNVCDACTNKIIVRVKINWVF